MRVGLVFGSFLPETEVSVPILSFLINNKKIGKKKRKLVFKKNVFPIYNTKNTNLKYLYEPVAGFTII